MTSNEPPKPRSDAGDKPKPEGQPHDTQRDHEPLGDVAEAELSEEETEELAREIEAERDA